MSWGTIIQSSKFALLGIFAFAITYLATADGLTALSHPAQMDPSSEVIRQPVTYMIVAWCIGCQMIVCSANNHLKGNDDYFKLIRLCYTWGCAICLFHIVVAFHVGHAWSHEHAYQHVEDLSGVGSGIYVNYLFVAVWLMDVIWSWLAPEHLLHRSRWLGWSILVFMAFIVFNAAIVFGSGNRRLLSVVAFLIPLVIMWTRRPWLSDRYVMKSRAI